MTETEAGRQTAPAAKHTPMGHTQSTWHALFPWNGYVLLSPELLLALMSIWLANPVEMTRSRLSALPLAILSDTLTANSINES